MLNLKWYWYIVAGIIIGMIISYMLKKPATTVNVQNAHPAVGVGNTEVYVPGLGYEPIA